MLGGLHPTTRDEMSRSQQTAAREKKWRQDNAERVKQQYHQRHVDGYYRQRDRERIEWLRDIKAARGCEVCGERDHRCLQFHHRDPTQKTFTIGSRRSASFKTLAKEVEKCAVLCANCHFKLHAPE